MNTETKLILPTDVTVAPVAGLPSELSQRVAQAKDDFYVTRPRTRSGSIIVDAQTAALLEHFRVPTTVNDAIIAFSLAKELDPMSTLGDAYDTLVDLVAAKMLVSAESSLAQPIAMSLTSGTFVENFEVLEPMHLLDDTEVYLGRTDDGLMAALKIIGLNIRQNTAVTIHHEANILARLDGKVTPRLLAAGRFNGRSFIVTTWHFGVDLYRAAGEARILPEPARSDTLLRIALQILRSYAHLHSQDALHGDVHPRNILIDEHESITIIDFGLAVMRNANLVGLHGGIDLFQAPEIARANLDSCEQPILSTATEQYSIGALLYFLLTGGHTHSFSLQHDVMLNQIINDPPLPFTNHGIVNFIEVESCIRRSLAKDPRDRYPSIEAMLKSFMHSSENDQASHPPSPSRGCSNIDQPQMLLKDVLDRLYVHGYLYKNGLEAPTASITYGAAGIAYFLLRMARSRDDPKLLASADQWLTRFAHDITTHTAFWNVEQGIVPEVLGQSSLFHHACGIHCVQALIAHARGDDVSQQRAIEAYLAASEVCDQVDVAFGQSGLLIGCAMLLDITSASLDSGSLLSLGQKLLQLIWLEIDNQPPLNKSIKMSTLGAAHGWCGYLYSTMRWCDASGAAIPPQLGDRLQQLAALGQSVGRGIKWPRKAGDAINNPILSASWCNGTAGYVYLWTMACRLFRGEPQFESLARKAAWHAYDGAVDAPGDLCCGLAGRAYSLLCLYKYTGELAWLERAGVLAKRAASNPRIPQHRLNSLYHGDIGIAMLAADLASPEFSSMPFFEGEQWLRVTQQQL